VLVGHFLNIDLKVLRKELGDVQHQLSNPAIDTARVHRWILQNSPYREDLEQQLANVSLAAWRRSTISTSTKRTTRWKMRSSPLACGRNS
jgi:hypothetical protein